MDTAEIRMRKIQDSMRGKSEPNLQERSTSFTGGKIRFFLAVMFFCLFYLLEVRELSFMGITAEKIYKSVCENAKGFDFVLDFPYTLND